MKMPVRDMLRNIRIAKGIDPKDLLVCRIFFFYVFTIILRHIDHGLTVFVFLFFFRENILRHLKVRLKYINVSITIFFFFWFSITILTSLHF